MNNKTKHITHDKKKHVYTREDLLGIEKAFSLGDSEVISSRIMDFILKIVMNKIRIKYVESLMNSYIIDKTFGIFNNYTKVQLNTSQPDLELEKTDKDNLDDYDDKFDVVRPKVDSWASNKLKIKIVKPSEVPGLMDVQLQLNVSTNIINPKLSNKSFRLTNKFLNSMIPPQISNKMNTGKKLAEVIIKKEPPKEQFNNLGLSFENLSNFSSSNILNKTSQKITHSQSINNYQNKMQDNSIIDHSNMESNIKRNIKEINKTPKRRDLELEQYPIILEEGDFEPQDELELVKLKTLRIYFKEKEIEKEKRRKIEKEIEDRKKEEEKKKKKLLEESHGHFSLDHDGRIVLIKPPDLNRYNDFPSANSKIKDKELAKNRDEMKKLGQNENNNINSNDNNNKKDEFPQTYYQPDPLVSHVLPAGVTLESYGIKKEGGKFPEVPGRLSLNEFHTMLNMYKPATNKIIFNKTDRNDIENEDQNEIKNEVTKQNIINNHHINNKNNHPLIENVISEEDEINLKESLKITKLFNFNEEGNLDVKRNKKNIDLLKYPIKGTHTHTKQGLNEIRKIQNIEKINAMQEFDLNQIQRIDDEKLYDIFNLYNTNSENVIKKKYMTNIPRIAHVDIEKELGLMKKYPRERLSKETLNVSGKFNKLDEKNIKIKIANKKDIIHTSKSHNF